MEFWSIVAIVLIVLSLAPFVYLLYLAVAVACAYWKWRRDRNAPRVTLLDDIFGTLEYDSQLEWTAEDVPFGPVGESIMVSIEAPLSGPSEEQRQFFQQIEQHYPDWEPAIQQFLSEYAENVCELELCTFDRCKFELCWIELPADVTGEQWTGQFTPVTEQLGDMGFFVTLERGQIISCTAVD